MSGGQPRYGAGPLITAGADLLCTMVDVQRRLEHPLGEIMQRIGMKPPRSHLLDPFSVLRQVRVGKRVIPALPRLERRIMA